MGNKKQGNITPDLLQCDRSICSISFATIDLYQQYISDCISTVNLYILLGSVVG
jgi:hypothetical protein